MMKIVFVSNFLNHHQIPICEDFIRLSDSFRFIATESNGVQGYQKNTEKEYVIHYDVENEREKAIKELLDADIAIMGACPNELIKMRAQSGKLTYIYSERFFRKSTLRRFIPTTRKKIYDRLLMHKNRDNVYVLAASAYLAFDLSLLHFPLSKIYKWGYFPKFIEYSNVRDIISKKKKNTILWTGRFLSCKHPEYAVELAKRLRDSETDFELNIIGDGECFGCVKKLIEQYNLQNHVHLLGSQSLEKVREYMENSEVFVFTSDKYEGWGAVLNEAMNSGCAVVASDAIGSVPFLIDDGKNGLIYRSGDIEDLYEKVKYLIDNQDKAAELGKNAYRTLADLWNSETAAQRFIKLSQAITSDKASNLFNDGPCSKADLLTDDWRK